MVVQFSAAVIGAGENPRITFMMPAPPITHTHIISRELRNEICDSLGWKHAHTITVGGYDGLDQTGFPAEWEGALNPKSPKPVLCQIYDILATTANRHLEEIEEKIEEAKERVERRRQELAEAMDAEAADIMQEASRKKRLVEAERSRLEEGTGMTNGIGEEEEEDLREKENFIDTGMIEELAEREEVRKRRLRDSEEVKELSRWIEIKEEKSEVRKRFGKNMPRM